MKSGNLNSSILIIALNINGKSTLNKTDIFNHIFFSIHPTIFIFIFIFFEFLNFILFYFYTAGSYQLSILYILAYKCQSQSPNASHHHPPCHFVPLGVHTFVLYICVSISTLQTSSSVPFFQAPHICVNIRYLFFSF